MTAAAGAAVSHVLQRRRLHTNFQANPALQTGLQTSRQATFSRSPSGKIVPASCAWAHEVSAGTPGPVSHAVMRITCSNLVEADDDFVRQYL
jgi:hypothetical protein